VVRVYYPFNPHISRAMHRIRAALMRYAPPGVSFVDSWREAELHILDFIGQHPTVEDREFNPHHGLMREVPSLPKCERYVLLFHCTAPPDSGLLGMDYRPLFEGALLVVSTLIPEWVEPWGKLDWSKIPLFHTPWGYDPEIFRRLPERKTFLCLMTGYVAETEFLQVVYEVAQKAGGEIVHIGGDIGLDGSPGYLRYEGVSDEEMCRLYSQSLYTNAMRAYHGFEMVGIEGAACGSQPVYLDLPGYRHWFSDLGLFVSPRNVAEELEEIFRKKPRRRKLGEKVERFKWEGIAPRIWEKIWESL